MMGKSENLGINMAPKYTCLLNFNQRSTQTQGNNPLMVVFAHFFLPAIRHLSAVFIRKGYLEFHPRAGKLAIKWPILERFNHTCAHSGVFSSLSKITSASASMCFSSTCPKQFAGDRRIGRHKTAPGKHTHTHPHPHTHIHTRQWKVTILDRC